MNVGKGGGGDFQRNWIRTMKMTREEIEIRRRDLDPHNIGISGIRLNGRAIVRKWRRKDDAKRGSEIQKSGPGRKEM